MVGINPRSQTLIFVFLALIVSAIARLIPLVWSSLPYNIDGLSELRVAEDVMASKGLVFSYESSHSEGYVTDMPILGLLIAFASCTIGLEAIDIALLMTATLGAVVVILVPVTLVRFLPRPRCSAAFLLALALLGSFVFSAGCTWKETLGILLLSLAILSFLSRNQPRYRMLLSASLMLLVFTHHHAAIVTFVVVTLAIMTSAYNRRSRAEHRAVVFADLLMLLVIWLVAIAYYSSVSLPYLEYLSPETNLYLYIAVAFLVLLVGIYSSMRARLISHVPVGIAVPVLGVFILLYNFHDPIFSGISAPSTAIMVPFIAYLLLVIPAWYGSEVLLARRGPSKDFILAMVLGPLSLILFAFLRANDATSHLIVYRTFDFLMIPFALFVGAGFAFLVKGRERLGILAGISLVIILASTLPVAYQTKELFGVQNHTFEYEYDAVQWFSLNGVDSYASDQRLGETGWRLFDIEYERGLPYDLREGVPLEEGSFFVLEGNWATDGAQEFPFGTVVVEADVISSTIGLSNLLYLGGPSHDHIMLFATGS